MFQPPSQGFDNFPSFYAVLGPFFFHGARSASLGVAFDQLAETVKSPPSFPLDPCFFWALSSREVTVPEFSRGRRSSVLPSPYKSRPP